MEMSRDNDIKMAMDAFLRLNGVQLAMSAKEKSDLAVSIATARQDFDTLKEQVAAKIKKNT